MATEWTYVCSVCTVWLYVCTVCTERTVTEQRLAQPDILPMLSKGSLIVGHTCFGRDWKECCFIYGCLIIYLFFPVTYEKQFLKLRVHPAPVYTIWLPGAHILVPVQPVSAPLFHIISYTLFSLYTMKIRWCVILSPCEPLCVHKINA